MKSRTKILTGIGLLFTLCMLTTTALAREVFRQQFGPVQVRGRAVIANPSDGPLVVSNIGSSGEDGVAMSVGQTRGAIGPIRWMAPEFLSGRGLTCVVHGEDDTGIPIQFAVSGFDNDLAENEVRLTPLSSGVTSVQFTIYSDGNPLYVGAAGALDNPMFNTNRAPSGVGAGLGELPYQPFDMGDFTLFYDGGALFSVAGEPGSFQADRVTLRCMPSAVAARSVLTGIEILGTEPQGSLGELQILDFPATFFGHPVGRIGEGEPTGECTATFHVCHLVAGNTGGGGEDGVSIALNETDSALGVVLDSGYIPVNGSTLRFGGATAMSEDGSRSVLPVATVHNVDSFFDIWTEVSVNDPPVRAEITLGDEIVAVIDNPSGPVRIDASSPPLKTSVQGPFRLEVSQNTAAATGLKLRWLRPGTYVDENGLDNDCDGVTLIFDAPQGGSFYDLDYLTVTAQDTGVGLDLIGVTNTMSWTPAEPLILDQAGGLGQAHVFQSPDGELVVDNLGSSGEDGVSMRVPLNGGSIVAAWNAVMLDPFRGHVTVLKAHGSAGGGGGSGGAIFLQAAGDDTQFLYSAGETYANSPNVTFNIYDQGVLIESVICAGTIEECLGSSAAPVSFTVVLDHPDGQPRIQAGLPPGAIAGIVVGGAKTGKTDKMNKADLIEAVFTGMGMDELGSEMESMNTMDAIVDGATGPLIVNSVRNGSGIYSSVDPLLPAVSALSLSAPVPNPFNPMTRIDFKLGRAAEISLRIYDLHGQLVRELHNGFQPAGHFQKTWNGLDSGGREVSSGTYLVQLRGGGEQQTTKAVLVR